MWFLFLFFALFFSVHSAKAEPTKVEFKILPAGEETLLSTGKARCYLLQDWLKLSIADSELSLLRGESVNLRKIVDLYQKKVASMTEINQSLVDDKSMLTEKSAGFERGYTECQSRLESCSSPVPWVIALVGGVVGAVGIAFAAGNWLGND